MPKEIISFGYKHGVPTDPDGFILDVRQCGFTRNPFHDKTLRYLRGTDVRVQEDVQKTPGFWGHYFKLKEALQILPEDVTVWLGCTGGRHRSVTLAIMLAKDLQIPCDHRDIHKEYK